MNQELEMKFQELTDFGKLECGFRSDWLSGNEKTCRELADLKEENTTKYNAVVDSVNLDEIREKAINQLGMTYATPDQIVEYDNPASDYVKQYENIPENGVLAQSDKNKK